MTGERRDGDSGVTDTPPLVLGRPSAGVDPYWLTLAKTLVMLDGELLADDAQQLEVALSDADVAGV